MEEILLSLVRLQTNQLNYLLQKVKRLEAELCEAKRPNILRLKEKKTKENMRSGS